jgi:hypothetical protein
MTKTNCINQEGCDWRETCEINDTPVPYDCSDYEAPEVTWTVVIDPDGDIVGVFDDTHLDEWLMTTVSEIIGNKDISEIDDIYAFASEGGVRFIDVRLNSAGLYTE